MRCLIALGLLIPFQDPDVSALIRKPGDERLEVRDQASRDLENLGDRALEPLGKAHTNAADPEVKARIGKLLKKIGLELRRRNFKGGKPAAGLSVRLEVDRLEIKAGGTFAFSVEILNVLDQEIEFKVPARITR